MRGGRSSELGVTLVEVLVAVTLLSLLTLGMLFAMRIGLNTLGKTDTKLMTNRRVAGAQKLLQQELEGLMPVHLTRCGKVVLGVPSPIVLFDGQPQSMRMVSSFSLQQAWRGQPQVLEFFVIPTDDGPGVRLVVNETPYSPTTSGSGCLELALDDTSGMQVARFVPPQTSERSFVLADKLAYCRFSYLVKEMKGGPTGVVKWMPAAPSNGWPQAIRIEMAPLHPDPSQLQPITITAPIYVHRGPQIQYGDY